jgi:hypothetical protein
MSDSTKPPLDHLQAHERIHAARQSLGEEAGTNEMITNTLATARRFLDILQLVIVRDEIDGQKPEPPQQPR